MATTITSTLVQELYTDIISDIAVYTQNQTLLNNSQFMLTKFNIEGNAGKVVRVPFTPTYVNAGEISDGNSIIAKGEYAYQPGSIDVVVKKYGVGTDIYTDALEDGGMAVVRQQLLNGLAGGLAQAIDVAGFAALADEATSDGGDASGEVCIVMSPMALAAAEKRMPTVNMFHDVDYDKYQFRATARFGWGVVPNGADNFGVRGVTSNVTVGGSTVSLTDFAKSVANLRAGNHQTMANGLYAGFLNPAAEYALAQELAGIQSTIGTVGALSAIGNSVLASSIIGQAVGIQFARSNNLATAS